MNIKNHTRTVNIIRPYSLGFASNSLTPEIWKIGTEYLVSMDDVVISDRTVFQEVVTYQSLEFAFGRRTNHTHNPTSFNSLLDLTFSKAFIVVADGGKGRAWGCIGGVVDKEVCHIQVVSKIQSMQTFGSGSKFIHTHIRPNLKYPAPIHTIICYPKLLAQAVEGEHIGNTAQIKKHRGMAKVSLRRSLEDPFIAVDANRSEGGSDVVDMLRAREQMDR
jgi:hypothetical protein